MAAIEYVDNTVGAGDNNGTSWPNAWRNANGAMESALASVDAGGTIYVQSDHDENSAGAALVLASANGVVGNPCTIVSVTNANEPPNPGDYQTMADGGGKIDTTDGNYSINLVGWEIWTGMKFLSGDNLVIGDNDIDVIFEDCSLQVADDTLIAQLAVGDSAVIWRNVDYVQETAGSINISAAFEWWGGTYSWGGPGAIGTSLFEPAGGRGAKIIVADVDIQNGDGGDYLVQSLNIVSDVLIKRCKTNGTINYMDNGPTGKGSVVRFHSVSDADNSYNFKEYYFEGMIEEATNVKLTGDWSAKMIADKGNTIEWSQPLRFKLADIYVDANATVTVNIIHAIGGAGADITDRDFWIEIESPLASAQLMLGQITSSRPTDILVAAQDLANNAEAWTENLANEVKQQAQVSVGAGGAGIYTVWACLAKEGIVYVDPIPVIS